MAISQINRPMPGDGLAGIERERERGAHVKMEGVGCRFNQSGVRDILAIKPVNIFYIPVVYDYKGAQRMGTDCQFS